MGDGSGRVSALASEPLRVVIAGGGTGGHLYPALAIAEAFRRKVPETRVIFLGTARGLEAKVVPSEGYELVLLPVRGLLRKMTLQNLLFPFRLAYSIGKCVLLFRRFRPHLVLGTGSYVAGPALTAARWLGIPRAIQEQNSFPGLVNRLHGDRADAVFLGFEAAKRYFKRKDRIFVYGNPLRGDLRGYPKARAYEKYGLQPQHRTLLIFGGSQGAKRLNEIVAEAIPEIAKDEALQILWLVGSAWYERWRGLEQPGKIKILAYEPEMAAAYAIADLALCRAGAMTIAELTLCGIPAIYVPFPFATADHQTMNARAVVEAGGGVLIAENELDRQVLLQTVLELLHDQAKLQTMADATGKLAKPRAAEAIVEKCLEIIERK